MSKPTKKKSKQIEHSHQAGCERSNVQVLEESLERRNLFLVSLVSEGMVPFDINLNEKVVDQISIDYIAHDTPQEYKDRDSGQVGMWLGYINIFRKGKIIGTWHLMAEGSDLIKDLPRTIFYFENPKDAWFTPAGASEKYAYTVKVTLLSHNKGKKVKLYVEIQARGEYKKEALNTL